MKVSITALPFASFHLVAHLLDRQSLTQILSVMVRIEPPETTLVIVGLGKHDRCHRAVCFPNAVVGTVCQPAAECENNKTIRESIA
jgi:hypothetical protein